jgi:hypothetical protein
LKTNQNILLISPPVSLPNTPYPAVPVLTGFLRNNGFKVNQLDLSLTFFDRLFTQKELARLLVDPEKEISENTQNILAQRDAYITAIEPVISFLRGEDSSLANRLANNYLPVASRLQHAAETEDFFGPLAVTDLAKYKASLFLEDVVDAIAEIHDSNLSISRYAESLAESIGDFKTFENHIHTTSPLDYLFLEKLDEQLQSNNYLFVGFSVPFPGNFLGALKCCRFIRGKYPHIQIVMGGGFVNTELRHIADASIFNYLDFLCFDDGALPLLRLAQHLNGEIDKDNLIRMFYPEKLFFSELDKTSYNIDIEHTKSFTPDYEGLNLKQYIPVFDATNPVQRLWSDGRWNKLTLAHGCYWAKCAFCDTTLDYIRRYQPAKAAQIVDAMEQLVAQTGQRGFHFVDEAAPPALLRELSLEILRRKLQVSWWANIRFEKAFTADLCRLMSRAGCIAVTGGLEVASDKLLKMMNKGVSLAQAAKVCHHFAENDIMVHTYLMYGFPQQNISETINGLEFVRQLFHHGLVQSAFWHKFALTVHSSMWLEPQLYDIQPNYKLHSFANNAADFQIKGEKTDILANGLRTAIYNFMLGEGTELTVNKWFSFKTPKPSISPNFVHKIISESEPGDFQNKKFYWIGNTPSIICNNQLFNILEYIFSENKHDGVQLKLVSNFGEDEVLVENYYAQVIFEIIKSGLNGWIPDNQNNSTFHLIQIHPVWEKLKLHGLLSL